MAGKLSGGFRKRSVGRASRRRAGDGARVKTQPGVKTAPKARSAAMRLAAKVDALKAELAEARARVAELETRVDEDPLTGLINRRGFERALERALAFVRRYAATAALLYLDLDRFKPVNDDHGHAMGDWVLGRVARLIAGSVRASDVTGRIGGDEFSVLLWHVTPDQAEEKARSLEVMLDGEMFEHEGKKFTLGLSVGVAMLSADDTVESALARADAAMYARKRERRSSGMNSDRITSLF